jgi:YD repeat-containing protein
MLSATDLVVPGRVPMALTRTYRSGDTNIGPFGAGTMMGYEEFLQQTSSTVLTYVYHGNARTAFVQQADGTFVNTTVPAFRGAKITLNGDGTRTLRYKTGESVTFAVPAYGVPLQSAVTDANGNRLTLARESLYAATSITDDTGRRLTVWRDLAQTEHVTRVVDGLGRAVIYEYDDFNRLARVTNPAGGVTQYAYDNLHRMTAITDAPGLTYLTNTYDANYRVCQQIEVDGGVYTPTTRSRVVEVGNGYTED